MTITTFTILNGVLALGLLAGLAVVMLAGHRAQAPSARVRATGPSRSGLTTRRPSNPISSAPRKTRR